MWFCATVAAIVFFAGAVAGLIDFVNPNSDILGFKRGRLEVMPPIDDDSRNVVEPPITLVANGVEDENGPKRFKPFGPKLATVVVFKNKGQWNCGIKRVEFVGQSTFKTPQRETKAGAMPTIIANLACVKDKPPTYSKVLYPIPTVAGGEYVSLEVAVIDKRFKGWSLRGTFKVTYVDGRKITVPNVDVDILQAAPTPINSEYE